MSEKPNPDDSNPGEKIMRFTVWTVPDSDEEPPVLPELQLDSPGDISTPVEIPLARQQYAFQVLARLMQRDIDEIYPGMNDIDCDTAQSLAEAEIIAANAPADDAAAIDMDQDVEVEVEVDKDDDLKPGELALTRLDSIHLSLLEKSVDPGDGDSAYLPIPTVNDPAPAALSAHLLAPDVYAADHPAQMDAETDCSSTDFAPFPDCFIG